MLSRAVQERWQLSKQTVVSPIHHKEHTLYACVVTALPSIYHVHACLGDSTVDKSLLFNGEFQLDSFMFDLYCGEPSLVSDICILAHMHTSMLMHIQYVSTYRHLHMLLATYMHVWGCTVTQAIILYCKTEVLFNDLCIYVGERCQWCLPNRVLLHKTHHLQNPPGHWCDQQLAA